MGDFRKLAVRRQSVRWVKQIYWITEGFPVRERYGLSAQLRRSAVSVASNIAEGAARNLPKETRYHLRVAEGSLAEARTQTLIATTLRYVDRTTAAQLAAQAQQIRAMLVSLRKRVEGGQDTPSP
jgi:four helix bundle protein